MIPLSEPFLDGRDLEYITDCVRSTWVSSQGEFIQRFEATLAEYVGVKYAVACVSGTAALHVALVLSGVEAGEEVLVPTVSFISPVNAVRYVGAWPVFFDCDEHATIDVQALREFLTSECTTTDGVTRNTETGRRVSAILPVHVFGTSADMDQVLQLADEFGLRVIEDAAEALGSEYKGRRCGTLAPIACMSFNGNKIVTSGGGGAILTNDSELARRARYLTTQAKEDGIEYVHHEVGYNYRMNNLLAALGLAQLETIDERVATKRRNFALYEQLLGPERMVQQPSWSEANRWFYAYMCDDADHKQVVLAACADSAIQVRPLWYLNHLQRPYLEMQSYRIKRAINLYDRVVNLPCSVSLSEEQVATVVQVIQATHSRHGHPGC